MAFVCGPVLALIVFLLTAPCGFGAEPWETLVGRADSLFKRNATDSALTQGCEALERVEADSGLKHVAVAKVVDRLAVYSETAHYYEDAVSYQLRALRIRETALGSDHLDVAKSLDTLARLYHHLGRYSEAEPLHLRSMEIKKKQLPADHNFIADTMSDLAIVFVFQGKYSEAEPLLEHALTIRQSNLGSDHPVVVQSLINLGSALYKQGKYRRAEQLYLQSLDTLNKSVPADDPLQVLCRVNLANTYRDQGRYAEAYPLYEYALHVHERTGTTRSREVSEIYLHMGILYYYLGLYSEAVAAVRNALDTAEDLFGPDNLLVGWLANNLAVVHAEQGDYVQAGLLWERALSIKRKLLPQAHPETATTIFNLAVIRRNEGRYAESEAMHAEALTMRKATLPPTHPDIAQSLLHLAQLCLDMGDLVRADSLLEVAFAIQEESVGGDHPDALDTRLLMCELRLLEGKPDEAFELASYAENTAQRLFKDNAVVLTEDQTFKNSRYLHRSMDLLMTSFEECMSDDELTLRRVADAVINCKGRASDEVMTRWRSVVEESDSASLALFDQLIRSRSALSDLLFERSGDADADLTRARIDSIQAVLQDYESALTQSSVDFRLRRDWQDVTVERVMSLLPEDAVLIEYFGYDRLDFISGVTAPHYATVVLGSRGQPFIGDIGPASVVDSLVEEYRKHMAAVSRADHMPVSRDMEAFRRIGRGLCDAIIGPLEDRFRSGDRLFIAADGNLNLVSFASLVDDHGRFLIESHAIHYVSAARDIIRLRSDEAPGVGLLAVGDPDFYGSGPALTLRSGVDAGPGGAWNLRSAFGDFRALKASRLEKTAEEIRNIAQLWENQGDEPIDILTWSTATEENVKRLAAGKRCVHLATHGFYLKPSGRGQQVSRDRLLPEPMTINPLLASGVLLAGSNRDVGRTVNNAEDDGILTAYEIAGIDLRGADLVVLSACETGLGAILHGEGVYGLRRAFELAGARTVVSSLWPVPDAAAADMMSAMYAVSEESIVDRLRRAQLDQISRLRREGRNAHPYVWAAFIATGDWK
ncbi:MAG: CHAT domain-containing tetratricopeptide repeat protein [Candidatus Eisenbacteria bacterium]